MANDGPNSDASAAEVRDHFVATLARVRRGHSLPESDAERMMDAIMSGGVPAEDLRAYLLALAERGETVDELVGSARSLRRHMLRFDAGGPCIDTCGTGGDGLGTFNISTAVALVVAAAGVPVAKAGNRSASSKSGSADLLEALGIPFDLPPEFAQRVLRETNFAFLFAPRYHPAARHAAPVRRALGRPTIFNWIGPICNPASPSHQVIGVPGAARALLMAQTLARLDSSGQLLLAGTTAGTGTPRTCVVSGAQGMDELALADGNQVFTVTNAGVSEMQISAREAGLVTCDPAALRGGDAAANAAIVTSILAGEPGPGRDVVCLNAALALQTFGAAHSLREGAALAAEVINSGAAQRTVEKLRSFSRAEARN